MDPAMSDFQEILLQCSLTSDEGTVLPAGIRGHILEDLGPEECLLEFSLFDGKLEGDVRIETCLATYKDFVSVSPGRVPPEKLTCAV